MPPHTPIRPVSATCPFYLPRPTRSTFAASYSLASLFQPNSPKRLGGLVRRILLRVDVDLNLFFNNLREIVLNFFDASALYQQMEHSSDVTVILVLSLRLIFDRKWIPNLH